jgi:hypothetical protein
MDEEYQSIEQIVDYIKKCYSFNKDGIVSGGDYVGCTLDTVYFAEILSDGAEHIDISDPNKTEWHLECLIEATDTELEYFKPENGKVYFWFSDNGNYCEGEWVDKTQYDNLIKHHKSVVAEYNENRPCPHCQGTGIATKEDD